MWKDARLLLLALTIIDVLDGVISEQLRVGDAVNVFHNYGNLSGSMRVVRLHDRKPWIFREPTFGVYRHPVAASRGNQWGPDDFGSEFSITLCDNFSWLLQSYFDDFDFEGVENPWRAFLGSRSKSAIAFSLGIEPSFIANANSYILVRSLRFREEQILAGNPESLILEKVAREADNVTVGDHAGGLRFISRFGSHYIDSFTTGDSLYQVFVFGPRKYLPIKNRLTTYGIAGLPNEELSHYFSPQRAKHIGAIQSASGNLTVEAWAKETFSVESEVYINYSKSYININYTSLFRLRDDTDRLQQLAELLGNEALLKLRLRTLKPFFRDPKGREYFLELIDNTFNLWDANL